jgi:hypothetical protein
MHLSYSFRTFPTSLIKNTAITKNEVFKDSMTKMVEMTQMTHESYYDYLVIYQQLSYKCFTQVRSITYDLFLRAIQSF